VRRKAHSKKLTVLIGAVVLAAALGGISWSVWRRSGGDGPPPDSWLTRLETEREAIEQAYRFTGFDALGQDVNVSAEREMRGGSAAWRVTLSNVRLRWREGEEERENPHIRSLDVFLDPETGRLLKIISPRTSAPPVLAPKPSLAEYPENPPGVSFMQALAASGGFFNPAEAKQIVACYILDTHVSMENEQVTRPAWVFRYRALPAGPLPGGGEFDDVMHNVRSVVDAETGEDLGGMASN